ncbi:MAG: HTH domain-containing protein [Candidatus Latescibacterota bacterium]
MTARQLAEIFDFSVRTIYRDMESLSRAEVPSSSPPGPDGGYRLLDTYALPPVMFKIEDVLPAELYDSVQTTVKSVLFDTRDRRDYSGSRQQFEVVLDGIRLRRRIDIRYKAAYKKHARSRRSHPGASSSTMATVISSATATCAKRSACST